MEAFQKNLAFIDIGSQTFRLVILSLSSGSSHNLDVKFQITKDVQLAENLGVTGFLGDDAMERGLMAIREFQTYICKYQVHDTVVVATHPLRIAKNSHTFIEKINDLGIKINVLSEFEEAELASYGASQSLSLDKAMVIDIGGGSTEMVLIRDEKVIDSISIPFGAVGLMDQYGKIPNEPKVMEKSFECIFNEAFGDYLDEINKLSQNSTEYPPVIIGGAATTIAFITSGLAHYNPAEIRGVLLHRNQLENLWQEFLLMSCNEISEKFGINSRRSKVVHAGIFLIKKILNLLKINSVKVSDAGLLMGLMIKYLKKEFPNAKLPHPSCIYF